MASFGVDRDSAIFQILATKAAQLCEPNSDFKKLIGPSYTDLSTRLRVKLGELLNCTNGILQVYQLCQFAFSTPCGVSLPRELGWQSTSSNQSQVLNLAANRQCILGLNADARFVKVLAAAAWCVEKYPGWLSNFHQKVEQKYLPEIVQKIKQAASQGKIPLTPTAVEARLEHLDLEVAAPGHGLLKEGLLGCYEVERHLVVLGFQRVTEDYERFVLAHELLHALSGRALRIQPVGRSEQKATLLKIDSDLAKIVAERHGIGIGLEGPYSWLSESVVDLLSVQIMGAHYFSFIYENEKLLVSEIMRRGVPWKLFLDALFDEPVSGNLKADFSSTRKLIIACEKALGKSLMRRLDSAVRREGAKKALKVLGLSASEHFGTTGYL